ncbi:MAG: F0F1 ATP synthase subunit B/delta [Mycobacterium sp.]|nr:F0F1 ATP synthase subunit B/delta [Mycobacterium sp.]
MSTFIGQLIGFAVIVWFITKFVVPPIRRLMANQKEAVRTQIEESAKAAKRLAEADKFHAARVAEAKVEAAHIVEEARTDSVRIGEQLGVQAGVDAERIKAQGGEQVQLLRSQLIRQLRGELGSESVSRAADLVRAYVANPQALADTVDRFLDDLDAMAPTTNAAEIASPVLRSASRDAQTALVERFDAVAGALSAEQLAELSGELAAVVKLLEAEPILARHLAEASRAAGPKKQLLERLLGGKVGVSALEVLDTAASVRWSLTSDFVNGLDHVAQLALLERADREGHADEVAEQLFRFGRLLDAQPQLNLLLSDTSRTAEERLTLLRGVLARAGGVNPTAAALLAQSVELLSDQRADEAVNDLAQLAIARRGEVVAEVVAAADLSDGQRSRLAQILTRIYQHPVSVQLTIDRAVLGGLSVAVGDEVIDGTLSSRLTAAATGLPD